MVWPTLRLRKTDEQNRTEQLTNSCSLVNDGLNEMCVDMLNESLFAVFDQFSFPSYCDRPHALSFIMLAFSVTLYCTHVENSYFCCCCVCD